MESAVGGDVTLGENHKRLLYRIFILCWLAYNRIPKKVLDLELSPNGILFLDVLKYKVQVFWVERGGYSNGENHIRKYGDYN